MVCSVGGCEKKSRARGWCNTHYMRWHRTGDHTTVKNTLGFEHPTTKKASRSPTMRDIEWAAGFLEGEGCFTQSTKGCEVITAVQTVDNLHPLNKLLDLFGGSVRMSYKAFDNCKECHRWQVSGSRARGIMMTLYTLLSPKKQEHIHKALA